MRRFVPTREFYIPKGATKVTFKNLPKAEVYFKVHSETYTQVMGFYGRAQKPAFHYRYKNMEAARKSVTKWVENLSTNLAARAEQKKKDSGPHDVRIGDIFYSSWGYDQTNIYFYQVIGLKGAKTAIIRRIRGTDEQTGFLSGTTMPVPNSFLAREESQVRRIQMNNGNPYFKMSSYEYAYPWDGKEKNWTAYH